MTSFPNRPTKMIKCFVCSFNFENPQKLCEHLKIIHRKSGKGLYECMCGEKLTEMWKFRRHLDVCQVSVPTTSENVSPGQLDDGQIDLLNFESKIHKFALEFICKLAGNMSIPRNYVFELLHDFQTFYSKMLEEGINQYVKPFLPNERQINIEYLQQIFKDPFKRINTEHNLDTTLKRADLISPLTKVRLLQDETSEESCDGEKEQNRFEKESVTIMPLEFQFKKFFELPDVFRRTQEYAKSVREQNLGHFINAKLWKKKLESFKPEDVVIPFHLHTDDVQTNNALGSHRSAGLETCTYYSFPTVPPEYNSRLQNIFVAQIFSSYTNKKFGNFCCFNTMISQLNKFGQDGITLNLDGKDQKVKTIFKFITK